MKLIRTSLNHNGSSGSSHHKKPLIWILVADKHIVRLFTKNGHGIEAFGEIKPEFGHPHHFTNKTVGRVISSGSATIHHKYEPHMHESRKDSLSFAHEIAEWLDKSAQENCFERLVLVAAPQTLGDLRKVLTNTVQMRVIAEIDKNLTKMNERELQAELERIVWF